MIESELQKKIVEYLKRKGISQRKFAADTGYSNTIFGKYAAMTSAMGIDVLDKVLSTYPEIKAVLAEYVGANPDLNHTQVKETEDSKEMQAGELKVYRMLFEGKTDFTVIPRKILDDAQLVSKDQVKRMWDEIEAKNKEIAAKNSDLERMSKQIENLVLSGVTAQPRRTRAKKSK